MDHCKMSQDCQEYLYIRITLYNHGVHPSLQIRRPIVMRYYYTQGRSRSHPRSCVSLTILRPKKYVCLLSHAEKNRVGLSEIISFYAPGLKGPSGASSNRIVRPSVCPSVRPSVRLSVCLSVIPSRLQTKCNI